MGTHTPRPFHRFHAASGNETPEYGNALETGYSLTDHREKKPRAEWLNAQELVGTAVNLLKDSPSKLEFNLR